MEIHQSTFSDGTDGLYEEKKTPENNELKNWPVESFCSSLNSTELEADIIIQRKNEFTGANVDQCDIHLSPKEPELSFNAQTNHVSEDGAYCQECEQSSRTVFLALLPDDATNSPDLPEL